MHLGPPIARITLSAFVLGAFTLHAWCSYGTWDLTCTDPPPLSTLPVDVVQTFETYLDVYQYADSSQRGQYAHIGSILGANLLGSNPVVDEPISISLWGEDFSVLRPDLTVATFHAETLELVRIKALPEEVTRKISNAHAYVSILLFMAQCL